MCAVASVNVLKTLAELEEIRDVWRSWSGQPDSDMGIFLEVLASNPTSIRPHVIVAYKGGRPDAILVGRIDATKFPFRVGYWRFWGPRVRVLQCPVGAQRGDCSPQASELLLREALSSLKRGEADVIRLAYVPLDSPLFRLGRSLPGILRRDSSSTSVPHRTTKLPKTYKEMLEGFSGDFRRKLKQKARRLREDYGEPEFKCFEKPEQVDGMLCDVERIASRSYQRTIGAGFHDTPFLRRLLAFQARQGRLLAYVLYAKASPIAYWVGCLYQGVFYSDYMGYDPEFGKYSPGNDLEARVLEDLCSRHAKGIDLGLGDYEWKQRLGTAYREDADIYIFALTPRGILLRIIRGLTVFINETLKAGLSRLGVLSRVKAAWGQKGHVTSEPRTPGGRAAA
jgi:hypothetical protein